MQKYSLCTSLHPVQHSYCRWSHSCLGFEAQRPCTLCVFIIGTAAGIVATGPCGCPLELRITHSKFLYTTICLKLLAKGEEGSGEDVDGGGDGGVDG